MVPALLKTSFVPVVASVEAFEPRTGKRTFYLMEAKPDFRDPAEEMREKQCASIQARIDKLTAQADKASGLHQLKELYVEIAELEEQLEQLALSEE